MDRHADRFSARQVIRAAERYQRIHGQFPNHDAGYCPELGLTWGAVAHWLKRHPLEGRPEADSVAQIFAIHRGRPNPKRRPRLTVEQIMRWARAHHRRTGEWPGKSSGAIPGAPGETWRRIGTALDQGQRGLRPSSLARLLHEYGYKRRARYERRLSVRQILQWADDHHRRTGRWPEPTPTRVRAAPLENWSSIDQALQKGYRGLPGQMTLKMLLAEQRGRKTRIKCPDITMAQVIAWMKLHHRETGTWPVRHSGPVRGGLPHDTWLKLDAALWKGSRSLPGGTSLRRLRHEGLGVERNAMLARPQRWAQYRADKAAEAARAARRKRSRDQRHKAGLRLPQPPQQSPLRRRAADSRQPNRKSSSSTTRAPRSALRFAKITHPRKGETVWAWLQRSGR